MGEQERAKAIPAARGFSIRGIILLQRYFWKEKALHRLSGLENNKKWTHGIQGDKKQEKRENEALPYHCHAAQKGLAEEALIIETVQDVTDQKQAEEALRQLNDFNAAIINNAPVAIFTIDRSRKFTSVNPALADLSGLGPEAEQKLVGFNWLENPYTVRAVWPSI